MISLSLQGQFVQWYTRQIQKPALKWVRAGHSQAVGDTADHSGKGQYQCKWSSPFCPWLCFFSSRNNCGACWVSWLWCAESKVSARALCSSRMGTAMALRLPWQCWPPAPAVHGCCHIFMWGWLGVFGGVWTLWFVCCLKDKSEFTVRPSVARGAAYKKQDLLLTHVDWIILVYMWRVANGWI